MLASIRVTKKVKKTVILDDGAPAKVEVEVPRLEGLRERAPVDTKVHGRVGAHEAISLRVVGGPQQLTAAEPDHVERQVRRLHDRLRIEPEPEPAARDHQVWRHR